MLAEGDGELEEGFRVDKRSLRKQFYLKAGFGGMSLTCTKDHFRAGQIEIDEQTGTITITNQELASLLLDQKGE